MLALGWGLAAAIGAIAGMMVAPIVFLDPNMMAGILLYAFAGALLGGINNPWGAVIGGFLGLISAVVMVILSPSVWEVTLGNPKGSAPFPYENPAIFSMAIAFIGIWLFSITDNSARAATDRGGFDAQFVRCQTGIGASGASAH
jgi:Na+(H+)/acetate symporter ActP